MLDFDKPLRTVEEHYKVNLVYTDNTKGEMHPYLVVVESPIKHYSVWVDSSGGTFSPCQIENILALAAPDPVYVDEYRLRADWEYFEISDYFGVVHIRPDDWHRMVKAAKPFIKYLEEKEKAKC